MTLKPSGVVWLASSTVHSKPTSTLPMVITGLPISVEMTSSEHAGYEFLQSRCMLTCRFESTDSLTVVLDNLPLLSMILALAVFAILSFWSVSGYKTMMKMFAASQSQICDFLLRKCLDLQMAVAVQIHAPTAPQHKLDPYLAHDHRTPTGITAMVYCVLDLFDQLHSCILAYEQLVCDRDKVIKDLDDQVVVLKRSNTTKDKDLKQYKRDQTATNGVNTRLQTDVSNKAERIVTLRGQLGEEQTKNENLAEANQDLRSEAKSKDEILFTRDEENKNLRSQLKASEALRAQEAKAVKDESARQVSLKDSELANTKSAHTTEVKQLKDESARQISLKDSELANTKTAHMAEIKELKDECTRKMASKDAEQVTTRTAHNKEVGELKIESARKLAATDVEMNNIKFSLSQEMEALTNQVSRKDKEIEDINAKHNQDFDDAANKSACALTNKDLEIKDLKVAHAEEINGLEIKSAQHLANKDAEVASITVAHALALAKKDLEIAELKTPPTKVAKDLKQESVQNSVDDDYESGEALPVEEVKPKVSQKKKRRRRKRATKAENAHEDATAGVEGLEDPSDHETDSNPDFSDGERNATIDPSTGTRDAPGFVPINSSQYRAGPVIVNRSLPPPNAPTGPRGNAPINAPRGPRAARPTAGPSGAGAEGAFVQPSEFTMSLYANQS